MTEINRDIEILMNIMDYGTTYHIYPRATENILKILELVDVKNMDVYTVLSSSDIIFSLIDKMAKSIDTFDINPLTLRYYYLRKWMLEDEIIDGENVSFSDIYDIINRNRKYINEDEEQSVRLWNTYIKRIKEDFFSLYNATLFEYVSDRIPCCYDANLKYLLQYLNSISLVFDEVDIGNSDEISNMKKYDLVYLSNIMDLNAGFKVKNIRNRIYEMLNQGGQAICTNLVNHPYFNFFNEQKQIFEEKFEYGELFRERVGSKDNIYYRYIKK